MCLGDTAVYVTAVDGDAFPNGAPFKFRVIQDDGKQTWMVEHLNGNRPIPGHLGLACRKQIDKLLTKGLFWSYFVEPDRCF